MRANPGVEPVDVETSADASSTGRRKNLPGLNGIRGIAALWVVFYHIQYNQHLPVLKQGFLGVDLFFILSGFVLSHAHAAQRWTAEGYGQYLRARFARIFPMHWVALALLLVALLCIPELYDQQPNRFPPAGLVASLGLVQNWIPGLYATWNAPAWSLSAEWLMSLTLPLFMAAARAMRLRPAASAAACAACLGLFLIYLRLTHKPNVDLDAGSGMVRAATEFAAGCFAYQWFGRRLPMVVAIATGVLVAAGVLMPGWEMCSVAGAVGLILLASDTSTRTARFLSARPIVYLGDISFSIYILHWTMLLVSDHAVRRLGLQGVGALAWDALYVAAVICLSSFTYRLVEIPCRDLIRGFGRRRYLA